MGSRRWGPPHSAEAGSTAQAVCRWISRAAAPCLTAAGGRSYCVHQPTTKKRVGGSGTSSRKLQTRSRYHTSLALFLTVHFPLPCPPKASTLVCRPSAVLPSRESERRLCSGRPSIPSLCPSSGAHSRPLSPSRLLLLLHQHHHHHPAALFCSFVILCRQSDLGPQFATQKSRPLA